MKSNNFQSKRWGMVSMFLTLLVAASMLAGVVSAQAQTFTTLYSFQGVNDNEGSYPLGLVQGTDGNLYGVTAGGGNAGEISSGTFFKLPANDNVTIVCTFYNGACRDSQAPSANLVLGANGDFYGVDLNGQVIRLTNKGKLKVLYTNANAVPMSNAFFTFVPPS